MSEQGGAGRPGTAWTSALSTSAFAAVRSVGFEPVGQVMGSAVYRVVGGGWGWNNCGYWRASSPYQSSPVVLASPDTPWGSVVAAYEDAREAALRRMVQECSQLGGDGVVSAEFTMQPFPEQPGCLEFKVIGTAVRGRSTVRPRRPFTCHLDGQGFAKLLAAGWVPTSLLVGMAVGTRHEDYQVRMQRSSWQNTEVRGWTDLVGTVRAEARNQLRRQAGRVGGDGVILGAGTFQVWEQPCTQEEEDRVAQAMMIGTSIARFQRTATKSETLTVLPLNGRGERLRKRLADAARTAYSDPERVRAVAEELGGLDED